MAADTDTFTDVDWDETSSRTAALSRRDYGAFAFYAAMLALFCYDYFVRPAGENTFHDLFGFITFNFRQLTWVFWLTLGTIFLFGIVPLAQNRRLTAYYWRQFKKNKMAVASLIYLIVIFLIGSIGPLFLKRPELHLMQQFQPPVFFSVAENVVISCANSPISDPDSVCYGSWAHPLGTTSAGKDILTLVVYGMDVSMKIGLIVPLIVLTIGTLIGTVAAYAGGMVDEVLMRYVDVQATFPSFFLFLLLSYILRPSLFIFIVIFGLFGWEGIARITRSEALQRREEEYVKAADGAGAGTFYIIRRHLIPNVSSTVITAATLLIPGYILFEASLSFLGLSDPSLPSWGAVIASGRNHLSVAWWISTLPGFFLFFTILAFSFLGDALRDALDPRSES